MLAVRHPGHDLDAGRVGFIIGVIQDSMETAINSSGDVLFTATAEYVQWKKQGRKLPDFMEGHKKKA